MWRNVRNKDGYGNSKSYTVRKGTGDKSMWILYLFVVVVLLVSLFNSTVLAAPIVGAGIAICALLIAVIEQLRKLRQKLDRSQPTAL
jgi:hypothetical protein